MADAGTRSNHSIAAVYLCDVTSTGLNYTSPLFNTGFFTSGLTELKLD